MTATDPAALAHTVARESARAYQEVLGQRLVAGYLLGSLARGGYAPAVSDIDLAVVLTDSRDGDPELIRATGETLRARSPLHHRLSIFWGSLPALRAGHDDGRFPALDRQELAGDGVLLLGEEVARHVARPTTTELLLESARFAVDALATDEVIAEFHRPRRLLTDPVWFTKAVLFPVRFLFTITAAPRRAATNDEAIAWYLARPATPARSLVRLAERVRAGHPMDPAVLTPELAANLVPLYQHYLDEQTTRLRRTGAPADLVTAFTLWGRRLTAPG